MYWVGQLNNINCCVEEKEILSILGSNGVGKTTSIGKIAAGLKNQGKKVIMAAADTFRAAAIEQLTEWANRAGTDIIAQKEGFNAEEEALHLIAKAADGSCRDGLSLLDQAISLGAGEVNIDYIEAREVADIDGGTGETTIKSGKLSNLSFDLGVGEAELTSELRGDCDMDLGVGSLALTILGEKDDYTIEVNKGIGEYSIDGEKIHDNDKIGEGNNHLQIDGGIGDAKINFKENR